MVVKKEKEKWASFMTWTAEDVAHVAKFHWVPCLFAMGLLFFMGVEYTLRMVPSSSQPFDLGFVATRSLHRVLSASPELNTFLAFLNTRQRRIKIMDERYQNLITLSFVGTLSL